MVSLDKVIHFPRGIIGFEDRKDFTLLQIRPDAPFLVLQSMTDSGLGLLVADPYSFMDAYPLRAGDAEQKILQVASLEEVAVLVTVSIPHGKPEEMFLSLTGPILINHAARIGMQVPQTDFAGSPKLHLNTLNMQPKG